MAAPPPAGMKVIFVPASSVGKGIPEAIASVGGPILLPKITNHDPRAMSGWYELAFSTPLSSRIDGCAITGTIRATAPIKLQTSLLTIYSLRFLRIYRIAAVRLNARPD